MSAVVDNPREHARARAAKGALGLGRLLLAAALFELIVAAGRAIIEPEPGPLVLVHFSAIARAAIGVFGAALARGFVPFARALGIAHWAQAATAFFATSALLALLPLFAFVPEALGEATWDALLQVARVTTLVAATASCLLVARVFAERESQPFIARHLRWTIMPLLVCMPVALQAIDPALVPSVWIAPALAIALPWGMALVRLMRWDMAAWTTLAMLAVGGAVGFSGTPGPLVPSAIALAAVALLATIAASGALHELAPQLGARAGEGISRTLIRRLFDGTLGGEGSRVGDIDVEATPVDEEADEAEHLARVYRELGISPPRPTPGSAPRPAAEPTSHPTPEPPRDMAPLVPISREAERPREAEVIPLPSAFTAVHEGLRWCFASLVARVLVAVFGFLWSSGPLADVTLALAFFDLALVASSVPLAVGSSRLRRSPAPAARPLDTLAFTLALGLVALDVALAASRHFAPELRPTLLAIDGIVGVLAIGLMLGALARLFASREQIRLARRARGLVALLASWTPIAAAAVAVHTLPEADLNWLSWPLGLTAAAMGLALWIGLLWFVRDGQEATEPHPPHRSVHHREGGA